MLAEAFRDDVLPLLVDVPIAELNAATGLVAGYLTQIRTGPPDATPSQLDRAHSGDSE